MQYDVLLQEIEHSRDQINRQQTVKRKKRNPRMRQKGDEEPRAVIPNELPEEIARKAQDEKRNRDEKNESQLQNVCTEQIIFADDIDRTRF